MTSHIPVPIFFLIVFLFLFYCSSEEKSSSNSNDKKTTDTPSPSEGEGGEQQRTPFKTKDPLYYKQYYLKNIGQDGAKEGVDINVEKVWLKGFKGENINIGVFDSGLDVTHPDLKDNIKKKGAGI